MVNVSVCIGSACHLKGSYEVIKKMQEYIQKNNLNDKINVSASFCLGHCTEAVSVKVDSSDVFSVNEESVNEFMENYVCKLL